MEMTIETGEWGKASSAYTSPTSPGSAPADTASTLLYQHADHLTTRVTTDNAGTVANQQAHYPYGENWYATGTADPSVTRKFTSYRKETDASLASGQINYAVARYHGARIGRFHRPDPVRGNFRNPQRLNRYAYVTNNPVRYTDPRGLDMSDGIGPEWQCPNGPGSCIVAPGAGLMENPNASGAGNMGYNVFDAIAAGDFALANQLAAGNNPTLNYINQQNGYTDWINQIPVGCWDGSGFQNQECVANGGGGGGGVGGGMAWLGAPLPMPPIDCNRVEQDCLRENSYAGCIGQNAAGGALGGGTMGAAGGGPAGAVLGALAGGFWSGLVGVVTCPFNVEQHCAEKRRQCMRDNFQVTPVVPPSPS